MMVKLNANDDLLEKIRLFKINLALILKKEFNSKPVYNKKNLKTKNKSYGDVVTDFHDNEIPKAGFDCTCLAVITIALLLKKTKTIICKGF